MIPDPKSIASKAQFVVFLETLQADFKSNPEDWENATIDCFLDAMGAWIANYESYYRNSQQSVPPEPNWTFFAQALIAARTYE